MINRITPFFSPSDARLEQLRAWALQLKCLVLIVMLRLVRRRHARRPGLWLVGENFGQCLADNGYWFFRYCREQHPREEVWFVARSDAIARDPELQRAGNTAAYGSWQHVRLLHDAAVLFCTHTHRDLMFHRLFPLVRRGARMVFLRHGVTGFKRFNAYYQEYRNEADVMVAVSEWEKELLGSAVGIDPERIQVTGFARHDRLAGPAESRAGAQILYMPTFRDWIGPAELRGSRFFREVSDFIADPALAALLDAHGCIMKVYLHKNMRDCLPQFRADGGRVRLVAFGEESVQELLCGSRLLITDYSSVSWDFLYMGRPVVFFQFDAGEYLEKRGAYLDMERDLFGDRALNRGDLLRILQARMDSGFARNEGFEPVRRRLFAFTDTRNRERIYRAAAALEGRDVPTAIGAAA